MATQRPVVAIDIAAISAQLLENREVTPRARILARALTDLLPGTAINVYLLGESDGEAVWIPQTSAGEVTVADAVVAADQGVLGSLAANPVVIVLSGKALVREQYAHLHVRRTLNSLAYLPLKRHDALLGAVEILSFDDDLSEHLLALLEP